MKGKKVKIPILPNLLTAIRIVGAASLLFIKPFCAWFYIIYTLSGLSDVLDGFVARITKTTSEFGARLDSIADLLFYAVMLIRILPALLEKMPGWIWVFVAVVLAIRFSAYIVALFKYRRFASVHTYLNKATGLLVFFIPYFIWFKFAVLYCAVVCSVGALASTEELIMHIVGKSYSQKKSLIK